MVGVLALGGWLAIHGSITLGTFLAFSSLPGAADRPGAHAHDAWSPSGRRRGPASSGCSTSSTRSPPSPTSRTRSSCPPDAAGLSFDDVRFGYVPSAAGAARPVAPRRAGRDGRRRRRVRLGQVHPGAAAAPLLRPRRPARSGSAGTTSRDVTRDSLRAAIGLVMEDSFLFSDTIRANIAYGRPDATDEQVVAAAQAAQAHEFIVRAAPGLRHRGRRAGPDPVRRPAAAGGAGPRAAHRPPAAAARRRDLGRRPAPRGRDPRHAARGHAPAAPRCSSRTAAPR